MQKNVKIVIWILSVTAFICLVVGILLIAYPAYRASKTSSEPAEATQAAESIYETEAVSEEASSVETADITETEAETESSEESIEYSENPHADYFEQYPDIAAWLYVEDTVIDYPVMWTPGDENQYLLLNYKGQSDSNGSLLLDTDSCVNPLTTNLIIHGHNMKSGAMFGSLSKYADQDYEKGHSIIHLSTRTWEKTYEVVAVFKSQVYYKSDTCFKYYNFFNASTEAEFNDFYDNIKALSLYDTGVTASYGDNFLTLSTCAYHVENGRFVVVAKELDTINHFK